jgi:hypothetical protein
MTRALFAMNNCAQNDSQTKDFLFERHKAIRHVLASARPAWPEDISRRSKILKAREIWDGSRDPYGTIVEVYLYKHAAVTARDILSRVRFNLCVLHEPTGMLLPAMIAPVYDIEGKFVGIHRTYLESDGSGLAKVSNGSAQRMLGDCFGSYIQLKWPTDSRLVVTKSVEMALSIQQFCPELSVWSAMSFGNMKAPLPPSVKEVTLCADGDAENPANAAKMVIDATREHLKNKLRVLIARPTSAMEFGDLLRGE